MDDALELLIEVDGEGTARLARLVPRPTGGESGAEGHRGEPPGDGTRPAGLPLVDIIVSGSGRAWSGRRYAESVVGGRLRYVRHTQGLRAPWRDLRVELEDPVTGLRAEVVYAVLENGGVLRSRVHVVNGGDAPVTLDSVTSFLFSGLTGSADRLGDVDVLWAENDWLAEYRWQSRALRDALPDLDRGFHLHDSRGRFGVTSFGGWSSGTYLPMGAAINRRSGNAWVWQIEHNGGWHWQVGERASDADETDGSSAGATQAYLALLGPTDAEHHWRLVLQPGEAFETVPAAVALSGEGIAGAVARLTNYRRAVRRPHDDHRRLPVIFNDFMNTLMGAPTTERLTPLIGAAAKVGVEYFCIDSGWYSEIDEGWEAALGEWKPSKSRFSDGLKAVLDLIRSEGMVPGLWLEPEVVGVGNPVADELPAEAFFTRDGERVVEQGRYHLDFSHPAATSYLDEVVDFLVGDLGVGYLKMDYNFNVGPGTDRGHVSTGVGMLAHNRALLAWADRLLDRYPDLVLESCASGGMRSDYAMLSRFQLQSTSDQQNFLRYPPIAAAAPVAIAPEQAASWAYPQPGWSDEEIAFTLCNALLGRIHLSGFIDGMSESQLQLVAEAITVYKRIRQDLATATPFWPLGLPGWSDPWIALGMRSESAAYVVVWHREAIDGGSDLGAGGGDDKVVLAIDHLRGVELLGEVLFPPSAAGELDWSASRAELVLTLPHVPSARLVRLAPVHARRVPRAAARTREPGPSRRGM